MTRKLILHCVRRFIPLMVLATLLLILMPTSGVKADSVVTFPDSNLAAAIRDSIGKQPTDDILQSDLDGLTTLSAESLGIVDLTGLEHCTNLVELDLWDNQIIDISPLSGLTSLEYLILGSNQIIDISPLSGLTSLAFLYLDSNQISDIAPLVNNTGIDTGDEVYIEDNPLSATSVDTYIPQLQARQVNVYYDALSNQPPSQPSNVSPSDGATGVSLTPTLQSSAFSDPNSGDTHAASNWQVTDVPGDYSSPVFDSGTDTSNLTSIVVTSGMLSANTIYYWHVRYQDNPGAWSEWSTETSFTATNNQPPSQPSNFSPSNGATGVSLTPMLQSSDFSDPDVGDTHAASQWQITTTQGDYTSPVWGSLTDTSNLTSIVVPSGMLSTNTTYYWHVRHQDNPGAWSEWSTETSFTTITATTDDFGYTFKDSTQPGGPTYEWVDITTTGTEVLPDSDDQWVEQISVGFFFNFYGTDYSQVSICNNGIVMAGTGDYTNEPIGSSGVHNFIAPFWDDLVTWGSAGSVYYQTMGTAPNRMFVVEWYDNQHYDSSTSGITFEVILYEGSDNIKFQYQDVDFGTVTGSTSSDLPPYSNGGSATVGIESPDGPGTQYSYNQQVINPGMAILFQFPAFSGTNMRLSKTAPVSTDQGNMMTYTLYYNNFGSIAADNVTLQDTLPSNVDFVSASGGGVYDSVTHKVTWNIGAVPVFPSGRGSVTVTVRIPSSVPVGTVIVNTASIATSVLETRYDDNGASASTIVTGSNLPPGVDIQGRRGDSIYYGDPITFTYECADATGVNIRIHIDDGGADITGSMTGGPPIWSFTTTFYPRYGHATVTYTVIGGSCLSPSFNIYIDPSGYIYDVDTGRRISGATVWLQRPDGIGGWENVPTGQATMQPDTNPLTTGPDGQYEWDVLAGTYRVHVEAPGYYPADSTSVNIPPPVNDLHVGLTHLPIPSPTLASPVTGTITGDPTVDLDWGDVTVGSGATPVQYQVQVDNNNDFSSPEYDSGWILVSNATTPALPDNTYYWRARAGDSLTPTPNMSEWSTVRQFTIDNTPPIIPVVTDDGVYTTNGTQLHATWTSSDPESGIAEYQYAIGTTAGGIDVVGWTSAATAAEITHTGLSLTPGTTYYISVKAKNAAGLWSPVGLSDGIVCDSTPPSTPVVTDDGDHTTSNTQLHATWSSTDGETGIVEYQYAIGTTAGGIDVVGWTSAGTATEITHTGLSLTTGTKYYISVKAKNAAGLWSEVGSSDGIIPRAAGLAVWVWIIIVIAAAAGVGILAYFLRRRLTQKA